MRDIGPVATEVRGDGISRFGVRPNLARQRQQLQRKLEVDGRKVGAFGNTRPLWLIAVAELNIRTEAARPEGDLLTRAGINPELARFAAIRIPSFATKLARIFALGIVRTADEGTETAELQTEPAASTTWT